MPSILQTLHALQAGIAVYTGYFSYLSIQILRKYEETTKKAAQYSNEAEYRLHKTRTTQASGALSVRQLLSTHIFRVFRRRYHYITLSTAASVRSLFLLFL